MASLRYIGGPSYRAGLSISAPILPVGKRRAIQTSARILAQEVKTQSKPDGKNESQSSMVSPSSLSPSTPPPKAHSKLTVFFVTLLGRLMGYNTTTSSAIRISSELYDRCAEQAEREADFWYNECGLPRSYQTWFQITNLHVHLLLTRFRALEPQTTAHAYSQELINHYFIDAESRMRERFGVQTSRLVKGYLREMHSQQRGAILGMDEALSYSITKEDDRERFGDADAALATALWRNIWGAGGWGEGVGGVKRKIRGIDRFSEEEKVAREKAGKSAKEIDEEAEQGVPELALDIGANPTKREDFSQNSTNRFPSDDLHFAVALQRLVKWYRRETVRLGQISNEDLQRGRVGAEAVNAKYSNNMARYLEELRKLPGVANFSKI